LRFANTLKKRGSTCCEGKEQDEEEFCAKHRQHDCLCRRHPAIMGLQPLYFRDPELAGRARIPTVSAKGEKRRRWLTPACNNARKEKAAGLKSQ